MKAGRVRAMRRVLRQIILSVDRDDRQVAMLSGPFYEDALEALGGPRAVYAVKARDEAAARTRRILGRGPMPWERRYREWSLFERVRRARAST